MARAQSTDFLQNFRFQVEVDAGAPDYIKRTFSAPHGGFRTCTLPEFTAEAVEYKEGVWRMPKKFPGNETVGMFTLTRGIVKSNTGFYDWIVAKINGKDYRADLIIKQFHRDDWASDAQHPDPFQVQTGKANRVWKIHEAFPSRCKLSTDLDSTVADISVEELDVQCEWIDLVVNP